VKTPTCSIDALMPGREVGVNQRGITCSTLQVSLRGGKTLATPKSGAWSDSNARPLGLTGVRGVSSTRHSMRTCPFPLKLASGPGADLLLAMFGGTARLFG
jgi:hypothetical protein